MKAAVRHPPRVAPKQDERLTFTLVTDGVGSAIAQAKAAAGKKAVQVVGGVSVARRSERSTGRSDPERR